jgi:microcystin-dependent protein
MANPFIGMIELFAFNFAPQGYAFCSGQLLPINQNQALFALLGTTFGGNGQTTFALPDLRGRLANGAGQGPGLQNYDLGTSAGEETHALTVGELPQHFHSVNATVNGAIGGTNVPSGGTLLASARTSQSGSPAVTLYSTAAPTLTMAQAAIGASGGQTPGQFDNAAPHENRMPFLALNYCIALLGIFPSQN